MNWVKLLEEKNTTGLEIDACPYCGARGALLKNGTSWNTTYCVSCTNTEDGRPDRCRGVKTPSAFDPENPEKAIALWNKRYRPSQTAVLLSTGGNWFDATGRFVARCHE